MYYNRKIALTTLGCKLNYSETSAIGRALTDHGFQKVDWSEPADFYIINTCSVTENADRQTRQVVKAALRTNADAKIVVIGCYAQLKPQEIANIPGVNMVLGANEKFKLHEYLDRLEEATSPIILNSNINDVAFYSDAYSHGERTRIFLKVQDGCDYMCSFCTIPLARGKSRSNSIAKTVELAKKAAATGVKEIVLTGVNIGDYGKAPDGNERRDEDFFGLIQELEKIEEVKRWRISSIEPNLLTDEIIEFVAKSPTFMPHFHIPLQSGSDRILKYMRRKYLTPLYRERVAAIKRLMPHACIGVDVIVGFPGETEEEFRATYDFIHSLDVSYLHVFTYSERANTRALHLSPIVPMPERKKRNEMLRILSEKKKRAFYGQNLHAVRPVLWEIEKDGGTMYGFTDNYIKVGRPYEEAVINTIRPERLYNISTSGYVKVQMSGETVEVLQDSFS
jgi:threonylcarbamoyladenosine tRNA methylthiotransferase MtaB